MGTLLFATTRLRGLHAVGRTSDLQRDLLAAILMRNLGPAYESLFAEFETRDSDTRDWFVDGAPAPISIRDLPHEHAVALKTRCEMQLSAIRSLADRLDNDGANGRNLARALRDASVFPAEDLWLYKGAPLIMNWGFSRSNAASAAVSAISGATVVLDAASPSTSPVSTSSETSRKKRWLVWLPFFLWLAFMAFVARIYADLLPACGLQLPAPFVASVGNCPLVRAADDLIADSAMFQRQVEQAELDLALQQQTCARPRRSGSLKQKTPRLFAEAAAAASSPARRVFADKTPDRVVRN